MSFLDTRHKKKSFTLTTIILSVFLLLLFYIGLTYLDPPIENGIAVNFGTMDYGSGNVQPKEKIRSEPKKVEPEPVEQVQTKAESEPVKEEPVEKVMTNDTEETIKIKQQQEAKRKADEVAKKAKLEAERVAREKREAEERIRQEQEAKKKNLDALIGGIGKSDGTETGSEGDDKKVGDKGQPNGDPYANTYYGVPGSGSGGGGYGLKGRSLVGSDVVKQKCNEEGKVVVEIVVDRSGRVVRARPGVKGTENTAHCLLEAAQKTALTYRWNQDSNARPRQIGFVVVNFKLSQ